MWGSKTAEPEASATSDRAARNRTVPIRTPDAGERSPALGSNGAASSSSMSAVIAATRSSLGATMQIKGEISGSEDLELDCMVEGTIRLTGRKLTVGSHARIIANITAGEAVVYGSVKGNISATDRIEIKKDGSVVGELATARIMIEDGAYFKGTIAIDNKSAIASDDSGRNGRSSDASDKARTLSGGSPTLHLPAS